ncbi:MAG: hypothetical protein HY332_07360 [Chloroflexi bacterium]|nr:hypothetical protein [Chloroflexota bacterium]
MIVVLGALLAAVACGTVALVLAPLRRRPVGAFAEGDRGGPAALGDHDGAGAHDLLAARDAALEAIRELDYDYQLGHLVEDDYRELRERHKRHAIALLKATNGYAGERLEPTSPPGPLSTPVERGNDGRDGFVVADGFRLRAGVAEVETPVRAGVGPAEVDAEIERSVQAIRARRGGIHRVASANGAASHPGTTAQSGTETHPAGTSAVAAAVAPSETRAPRPPAPRAPAPRTARFTVYSPLIRWLAGGALATLVVVGAVVWLYAASRSAQQDQQPLAQLPSEARHYHTLAFLPGGSSGAGTSVRPASPAGSGAVLLGHHEGMIASGDGGRTWGAAGVTGDVMGLAVHPARPQLVYAAGHDVLLKSGDGGRTWAPLGHDLPGTDVHALAIDPAEPDRLYAIVIGHGIFEGRDEGTRWTLVGTAPGTPSGLAVWTGGQRAFYLATADQGVLVSADGKAWTNANGFVNGALPTRQIRALVYDPSSGDRFAATDGRTLTGALYAGTDRGLFKSVDGGGSWTRLPLQTDVAALAVEPAAGSNGGKAVLVVDGRGRVFRSDDGGITWKGRP